MPVYSSDFPELLLPTLRTVYDLEDRGWDTEWTQYMTVENSTKAAEKDFSTTGFGVAAEYGEGDAPLFDTVYRGWTKTYTHKQVGIGTIITRIMYEDDQYRHMKSKPKALARSMNEYLEILCANILNYATTNSAAYQGADGVCLAYSAHPTKMGGTWSNTISADLDITSLEQMLILKDSFINERGLKYKCKAVRLLCTISDDFAAKQMLKSTQFPGTANNDINPAQGILSHVVLSYVTDPDAWGIQTDAANGLLFFWRRNKEFTNDSDWGSENAKYKSTMRCTAGWTDPRCIIWSPGA
jgi:hypothetical protein